MTKKPATVTILHYRVSVQEDEQGKKTVIHHQPEVKEVLKNDLRGHQKLVGGMLECVSGPYKGIDLWANEEGRILELPPNRLVPAEGHGEGAVWDIHGDFYFARSDSQGALKSLTPKDLEELRRLVP